MKIQVPMELFHFALKNWFLYHFSPYYSTVLVRSLPTKKHFSLSSKYCEKIMWKRHFLVLFKHYESAWILCKSRRRMFKKSCQVWCQDIGGEKMLATYPYLIPFIILYSLWKLNVTKFRFSDTRVLLLPWDYWLVAV